MKIKITIILLLAVSGGLFAQIPEEAITLETETGNISGTMLYPTTSEKIPVVLIIAGSGPTDRNGNSPTMTNNSLKMLAEGLFNNGIASVRYDKRGIGESADAAMDESSLRFENYIEDAEDWVDLLEKDDRFTEIIILGHSEGSLIGMVASQEEEVSKFISLEGAGKPAGDIIKEQLSAQPPAILEMSLPILEKLEIGETVETVPQVLYSLFRPSVQPYMISWFKYDPQQEIAKLNKPVLIIQGTTDIQVSVSDAEKLSAANEKAELKIIEGMNHILKESVADRMQNIQTYTMPDLPLKQELIPDIVAFINE